MWPSIVNEVLQIQKKNCCVFCACRFRWGCTNHLQFQELSEAVGGTRRELAEVEAQLQTCIRERTRGALTQGELSGVADGAQMYQSVGKMSAEPLCLRLSLTLLGELVGDGRLIGVGQSEQPLYRSVCVFSHHSCVIKCWSC